MVLSYFSPPLQHHCEENTDIALLQENSISAYHNEGSVIQTQRQSQKSVIEENRKFPVELMEENCTPAQIAAASRQSPRGERENGDQDVASKSLAIPHSGHRTTSSKRKKIDLTLEWLDENYMVCEGVCLARCILYNHYLDFCQKSSIEPACAATFGKTIRRKFPDITTRRLGTRGHSKYHYYGIGIRETSVYYNSVFAGKGLTRFSPKPKNEEMDTGKSSPSSWFEKIKNFPEDYPDISTFNNEAEHGITGDEIRNTLTFYKAYCHRLLTIAASGDLDAISGAILGCWVDFPTQWQPRLTLSLISDLLTLYDILVCDVLVEILLPTTCGEVTEGHIFKVCKISKHWEEWTKTSLMRMPENLAGKKIAVAQQFAQSLARQTTFVNLSKTVRCILNEKHTLVQMIKDVHKVDLRCTGAQSFYANVESEEQDSDFNSELLQELKDLLSKQPTVNTFVEWLDSVLEHKVIKPSKQNGRSMKKRSHDFLLKWSFFEARVMHNLTINNATTINSFHHLRMMMDEYVWFAIETQFNNEKKLEARNTVLKHLKQTKTQPAQALSHSNRPSKDPLQDNIPYVDAFRSGWNDSYPYPPSFPAWSAVPSRCESLPKISPTAYDPTCLYTQQGQFYAESNIMQGTDTQFHDGYSCQLPMYSPNFMENAWATRSSGWCETDNVSTFTNLSNASVRPPSLHTSQSGESLSSVNLGYCSDMYTSRKPHYSDSEDVYRESLPRSAVFCKGRTPSASRFSPYPDVPPQHNSSAVVTGSYASPATSRSLRLSVPVSASADKASAEEQTVDSCATSAVFIDLTQNKSDRCKYPTLTASTAEERNGFVECGSFLSRKQERSDCSQSPINPQSSPASTGLLPSFNYEYTSPDLTNNLARPQLIDDQWGLVSPRNLDGKPSKPNELMVVSACSQSVADYLPSINNVLGSD